MDRKVIQERLATLFQQRDELRAKVAAFDGAIQDCQWFLDQVEDEEEDVDVEHDGEVAVQG